MSELNEVQQLLRQRADRRPPQEYFDDFLLEFQRRQRADLLRRPLWEIAWDRANIWLDGFRVPTIAYASILVAAVGITGLMVSNPEQNPVEGAFASTSSLQPATTFLPSTPVLPVARVSTKALPPSYVLEERPVSYDAPFSF